MELGQRTQKQASGQGKHLWHALHRAGTRQAVSPTLTVFGRATRALWPWTRHEYPGLRAGMVNLLGGRVKARTVTHWIAGRRRAPQWAVTMLAQAIDKRIAELQHAKAILEKEKGR